MLEVRLEFCPVGEVHDNWRSVKRLFANRLKNTFELRKIIKSPLKYARR